MGSGRMFGRSSKRLILRGKPDPAVRFGFDVGFRKCDVCWRVLRALALLASCSSRVTRDLTMFREFSYASLRALLLDIIVSVFWCTVGMLRVTCWRLRASLTYSAYFAGSSVLSLSRNSFPVGLTGSSTSYAVPLARSTALSPKVVRILSVSSSRFFPLFRWRQWRRWRSHAPWPTARAIP